MTPTQKHVVDFSPAIELEEKLSSLLRDIAYDIEHSEAFDTEQRAELHTILRALQANNEMHMGVVQILARNGEYVSDV
jgi:hypothetical protein